MKITVITGPMRSGKSKLLLEYINKTSNYISFKPSFDDRDFGVIKSRNGQSVKAININILPDIVQHLNSSSIDVVFIDEIQFFNDIENIKPLLTKLNDLDIDLVVSGLDMDSNFNIFTTTSIFMAYANEIIKLNDVCECCNKDKSYISFCKIKKDSQILTGDEIYEAICLNCYLKKEL